MPADVPATCGLLAALKAAARRANDISFAHNMICTYKKDGSNAVIDAISAKSSA